MRKYQSASRHEVNAWVPEGEVSRGGCGSRNSCRGHCPNSLIWDSKARRRRGSASASRSTAPSYVSGWNTLSAASAAAPVCLNLCDNYSLFRFGCHVSSPVQTGNTKAREGGLHKGKRRVLVTRRL